MILRKFIVVLLVLIASTIAYAGGQSEPAAGAPMTLVHWPQGGFSPDSGLPAAAALYEELYAEFERRNPDIRIDYESVPGGTEGLQHFLAAAGEGNLPDVGIPDGFWVPRLVARGVLQPLNDLWPEADRADFQPAVIDAVTVDGGIYALWFYNAWRGLVYRGDLLQRSGYSGVPPTDRDEYIRFARELRASTGKYIAMYPGSNTELTMLHMLGYFWGYGGRLVDDEGRPAFHEGANREALARTFAWYDEMINDLGIVPDAILTMDEGNIREFFYDESAFAVAQSSSSLLQIRQERPDLYDQLIVTNYPMEAGYRGVPHLVGWTYAIFTDDPARKSAAWKFVEWMNSSENLGRLNETHGHLPVRQSVSQSVDFFREDPVFSQVLEIVFGGDIRERPGVAIYPMVSEAIRSQLGDIIAGSITIDAAIDEAAEMAIAEWERMTAR